MGNDFKAYTIWGYWNILTQRLDIVQNLCKLWQFFLRKFWAQNVLTTPDQKMSKGRKHFNTSKLYTTLHLFFNFSCACISADSISKQYISLFSAVVDFKIFCLACMTLLLSWSALSCSFALSVLDVLSWLFFPSFFAVYCSLLLLSHCYLSWFFRSNWSHCNISFLSLSIFFDVHD